MTAEPLLIARDLDMGDPKRLLAESKDATVQRFLTKGQEGRREDGDE
jgi:hypothetical protein